MRERERRGGGENGKETRNWRSNIYAPPIIPRLPDVILLITSTFPIAAVKVELLINKHQSSPLNPYCAGVIAKINILCCIQYTAKGVSGVIVYSMQSTLQLIILRFMGPSALHAPSFPYPIPETWC